MGSHLTSFGAGSTVWPSSTVRNLHCLSNDSCISSICLYSKLVEAGHLVEIFHVINLLAGRSVHPEAQVGNVSQAYVPSSR